MPTIISSPKVMSGMPPKGKPVIAGTKITVESILERLFARESREKILALHPHLTDEVIAAAIAFAASALKADIIYPVTS